MHISRKHFWMASIAAIAVIVALAAAWPGIAQTTTPKPVITRDLDNGDRQEIYRQVLNVDFARESMMCLDPVPAGKRLIIEELSARSSVPAGQSPFANLNIGGSWALYIPLSPQGAAAGGRTIFSGAVTAKVRLAAGERVCVVGGRYPDAGEGWVAVPISGHLIDAP